MKEHPMHEIRTAEPAGYAEFLAELKQRIERAQLRASLVVNRELVLLYWQIGREILSRQDRESWGAKVIDRLAADLKRSFPDMRGFSPRNLKYMRAFAEAWSEEEFVQAVLAQITWYHNIALIEKLQTSEDRAWYARATVQHGWSRNILVHQIESALHQRQGRAVTNLIGPFHRRNPIWHSRSPKSRLRSPIPESPDLKTNEVAISTTSDFHRLCRDCMDEPLPDHSLM
jgi:predicted nuclease of restriction endonuclease-like (RecB) superfamily